MIGMIIVLGILVAILFICVWELEREVEELRETHNSHTHKTPKNNVVSIKFGDGSSHDASIKERNGG